MHVASKLYHSCSCIMEWCWSSYSRLCRWRQWEEWWRTDCNLAVWQVTYYMVLTHWNWNLIEFDHAQTWSWSKLNHIQTTPSKVSAEWFELIWTIPVIRNGRVQLINNQRYPLFPSFIMFQMGNGFAWTAKTTLGHLWRPESRKS